MTTKFKVSHCKDFIEFESNFPDIIIQKIIEQEKYGLIELFENTHKINKKLKIPPRLRSTPKKFIPDYSNKLPKCIYDQTDPKCLRELYSINVTVSDSKTIQAVANFGEDFFKPSDLSTFWSDFDLTPTPVEIMNTNDPSSASLESTLDLEYITGVGNNISTQFHHFHCTTESCHPFLTMLAQLSNLPDHKLPMVLSVSVGVTEYEYLNELGSKYADRVNNEFMKLGLRGVSIIFAIGDRADQE